MTVVLILLVFLLAAASLLAASGKVGLPWALAVLIGTYLDLGAGGQYALGHPAGGHKWLVVTAVYVAVLTVLLGRRVFVPRDRQSTSPTTSPDPLGGA